jgi:LysR family transcriptional regulator (chromosome initiation inhibitor)
MLDYASLAAVAAVVNEGSFERAARALNVTPSAVSQRVKLLEERLGRVLIARGQPCTATEAGRLLCRHIERVGMLEQDLRQALPLLEQSGVDDGRVTLRVAVNADSLGTWFIRAMAAFCTVEHALLDVALDDQDHTIEWLRSGEVLAAVTANEQPVQGCDSIPLGRIRYVAVCSPQYLQRYFAEGVTPAALARAPSLTFNRKDTLQARWIRRVCRRDVDPPTHWLPSTQGFTDASLAGVGWGMNPIALVEAHLRAGTLVELVPGREILVPLYWQHTRLRVPMLDRLTRAVIAAARSELRTRPAVANKKA